MGCLKITYLGTNWKVHALHERKGTYSREQKSLQSWSSVDPLAELMPEWSSYAYTFNNPVNFTDPTGMIPNGGGGCEDDDCDPPDQEGGTLGEVIITAKGGAEKERKHMPEHMKQPLDWWNSDFEGDMNEYNAKYGTDYKDDGTAYGYWRYDNFYEKEYNEMIRSMHEATSTAAEYVSYILPMPVAGGALITKAPRLVRGAKTTNALYKEASIYSHVRGNHYFNLYKRKAIEGISTPFSRSNLGFSGQRTLMQYGSKQVNYFRKSTITIIML